MLHDRRKEVDVIQIVHGLLLSRTNLLHYNRLVAVALPPYS